jgi:release factor glutamine methyltransferase
VDASDIALDYARRNAAGLGLAGRAGFRLGDWTDGLDGRFDLILANPPYIGTAEPLPPQVLDHEPAEALFAGADGLDDYRRIVPALPALLAPGGAAILEIGWTQADAVSLLGQERGLAPNVYKDMGGRPRVVRLT